MSKGFVTLATGSEHYYRLARNLLRSYRDHCKEKIDFCIISDRKNKYTKEFDDVVILPNASCSWMDKLEMLKYFPYDENVFIDADCLIYTDINYLWDLFKDADDFSCFGEALSVNSKDGWFTKEGVEPYGIKFVTHLHGMLYFVRQSEKITQLYNLCKEITAEYDKLKFSMFNDQIADEPVFALAMAVLDLKPIHRKPNYYCFLPFASYLKCDYEDGYFEFENPKDGFVPGGYYPLGKWKYQKNTVYA